jgi:hypothetical protein
MIEKERTKEVRTKNFDDDFTIQNYGGQFHDQHTNPHDATADPRAVVVPFSFAQKGMVLRERVTAYSSSVG